MRLYTSIVFQSIVSGTAAAYSPQETWDKLGQGDATSFQIIGRQPAGNLPITFAFAFETSNDGELWTAKTLTTAITAGALNVGQNNVYFTSDDGSLPSCGLARVRITLTGQPTGDPPQANFTVWACGRSR
jgi:hypothetical protein